LSNLKGYHLFPDLKNLLKLLSSKGLLPYAELKNILKSVFGMASFFCEGGFFFKIKKKILRKALWHGIGFYNRNF